MKELVIEWRHFAVAGKTCDRCSATGTTVREFVADLSRELAGKGIRINFVETVLPAELMAQSNMILFNDVPLEEILEEARAGESKCPSCSCLTGSDTSCRTVEHGGVSHEAIPVGLIRRAALIALGLAGDDTGESPC